ncbi:hypothetical protein Aduo_004996 [Ancylostoma duodenale]
MPKESGLVEIGWNCLVLGDHQPQEFDGGHWVSGPREEYPIDIVLGLEKLASIYKVIVEVDEQFVPSKIEICLGLGDNTLERNYKNARLAEFTEPVTMEFDGKQRISNRMEAKQLYQAMISPKYQIWHETRSLRRGMILLNQMGSRNISREAFMDSSGQYLWIIVYEPDELVSNKQRKVGIKKVTILGYPLLDSEVATLSSKSKSSKGGTRKSSASSRASSASAQVKHSPPGRYSYSGDGMYTGSSALGGDPLTTVRLVKKVLKEKMEKANESDREVEGTVCKRATQRLAEYEKMLEELAQRRSNALVHNETQQV